MLKIASVLVLALVLVQSTQNKGTINVKVVLPNKIYAQVSDSAIENPTNQQELHVKQEMPSAAISFLQAERSVDVTKLSEQSIQVWSQKSLEIEKEPEIDQEQQDSKKKLSIKVDKKEESVNQPSQSEIDNQQAKLKKFSVSVGKVNKQAEDLKTDTKVEEKKESIQQSNEIKQSDQKLDIQSTEEVSSVVESQPAEVQGQQDIKQESKSTEKVEENKSEAHQPVQQKEELKVDDVKQQEITTQNEQKVETQEKDDKAVKVSEVVSEATSEEVPKVVPEAVPKVAPEAVPEAISKEVPQVVAKEVPQVVAKEAPQVVTKEAPEQIVPEVVPVEAVKAPQVAQEIQQPAQNESTEQKKSEELPSAEKQAVTKLSSENNVEYPLEKEEEFVIQDIKVEAVPQVEKDNTQIVITSDEEIKVQPIIPKEQSTVGGPKQDDSKGADDKAKKGNKNDAKEDKKDKSKSQKQQPDQQPETNPVIDPVPAENDPVPAENVAGEEDSSPVDTESQAEQTTQPNEVGEQPVIVPETPEEEEQSVEESAEEQNQSSEEENVVIQDDSSSEEQSGEETSQVGQSNDEQTQEEQSNDVQSQEEQSNEELTHEENNSDAPVHSEEDASPAIIDAENKVVEQKVQVQEPKKAEAPDFMIKKNQLTKKLKNIAESMKQTDKPAENTLFSLNVSNLNPDEEVIIIKDASQFEREVSSEQENGMQQVSIPEQQLIGEVVQVQAETDKVDLSIFSNDRSDLIPIIVEDSENEVQSEIVTESIKDVTEKELEIIQDSNSQKLISDKIDGVVSNQINKNNIIQDDYQLDYDQLETDVVVNKVLQNDGNSFEDFQSQLDELSDQLDNLSLQPQPTPQDRADTQSGSSSEDQQYLTIQTNNDQVVQSSTEDDYYFEDLDNELDQIIQQQEVQQQEVKQQEIKQQESKQEEVKQVEVKQVEVKQEQGVNNETIEENIDDYDLNDYDDDKNIESQDQVVEQQDQNVETRKNDSNVVSNEEKQTQEQSDLDELNDDYLEVEQPQVDENSSEIDAPIKDEQVQEFSSNSNDGLVIDKGDYEDIYESQKNNIDTTNDYDFEFQDDQKPVESQEIIPEKQPEVQQVDAPQQQEEKVTEQKTDNKSLEISSSEEPEIVVDQNASSEEIQATNPEQQAQQPELEDQQEETIQKQIQEQTEEIDNDIALENDGSDDVKQQDEIPKIQLKKKQLIKKEVIASPTEQENVISTDDINADANAQDDVIEVFQGEQQEKSQQEDQSPEVIENLEDLKDCIENDEDEHTVQNKEENNSQQQEKKKEEQVKQEVHKLSLKVEQPVQKQEGKSLTLESNDKQSKFEQQLHQQIINKKQKEKQQLSHEEQFEQVVNELINGLESFTNQKVENREQEKVISQKIKQDVEELKKIHGIDEPIQKKEIKTENCDKEPQSVDDYIDEYYKNKEFQQKVEELLKSQPKAEEPKVASGDRYYLDKNKPVNQAVSDYEKELNQRKQEVLEKIKNDLQVKKGRFQNNQKADNLSPYEFERIYLDWQKNKQDIVSSMLQHASSAENEQPLEVSEEPVAKVERVSKKEEVELEIQELFSNYNTKGKKSMNDRNDENEDSQKYSFLSMNQKVKKNLRRNKQ